ncbi:MAG: glycosyltransferase [Pseudomonadota bacterium]|nr:glycosyltransferase [Pseudomonadota bacterium]
MGEAVSGPMPWAMGAGDVFDFDSYFNAFFPDVWRKHTKIGRVGLSLVTDGAVRVVLSAHGDETRMLSEMRVDGAETIWLDDLPATGRVTFRIEAEGAATLSDAVWVTDAEPLATPTLSVGLCTFNREEQFAVTLAALAQLQESNPAILHIWVANQGKTFTNPTIAEIEARDTVSILEQTNLGGCGGFTRTMVEATSGETRATHHLLMDDDIILDPRVVNRALGFLAYVEGELAVGGQMIDLDDPIILRELGAKLDPERFVHSIGENSDLTTQEGLAQFHETPRIDYNAWWFCVIPTKTIERLGLPTPIFIRGDDIEYGCRMAANGVETICLPGVAVWHESFHHKTSDWLTYYDMRNRLFVASLYPQLVWRPAPYYLLGFVIVFMFQNRYRAADMNILAIQDVLAGLDSALGSDSESRHMALMASLNKLAPYVELAPDELPETVEGTLAPLDTSIPSMVWLSVRDFVHSHFNALLRPFRKPRRFPYVPMPNNVRARDYVAPKTPEAERFVLYKARPLRLWSVMTRTLWVCARYGMTPRSYFDELASALEANRSRAHWQELFDLPRDRF